jgi:hypothetical protein
MADLEEDDPREDHYAQNIADRESWLRSFGMTPYTTPDRFMAKMNKENIKSRKIYGMFFFWPFLMTKQVLMERIVDGLPPCEKVPGKVTDGFKQYLNGLKQ